MSVDAFGRVLKIGGGAERGPPGIGYQLTSEGNFDVENKRLCHVADPTEPSDAVNLQTLKRFIDSELQDIVKRVNHLAIAISKLNKTVNNKLTIPTYFKNGSSR